MLFTSFAFAIFLLVLVPLFFALPQVVRPALLALASYFFYTYEHPEWWWVLFSCTAIAYLSGLALERWRSPWLRRLVLAAAILANAGMLIYFKYADLLLGSLHALTGTPFSPLRVVLPVGISFFTFQALSYVIDVYRGQFPAEHRFDIFAAYKAFFPQLVAGPIERPGNVIPQLRQTHAWDYDRVCSGCQLILWGLFKKLLIADRLAPFVNSIYTDPHHHSPLQLVCATYAFAFQIFCDFSAYTDIARGTARIFGISLMENFRAPYHARSVPEFWSRWHISLSTWFRDYLYIPLGGNRVPWVRWWFNISLVFLVSGIWHGADWKFAVWGMLHALFFLLAAGWGRLTRGVAMPKWVALAQIFVTFHAVVFAWVFFRASSLADAWYILGRIASHPLKGPALTPAFGVPEALLAAGAILLMEAVHLLHARRNAREFLAAKPIWIRWPAYYALILAVAILGPPGRQDFIYFQF